MIDMPHQAITRALGGTVAVVVLRDPADGSARYAVSYHSGGTQWLSCHRFQDISQCDAACVVLADFLGAEVKS
jgi:hypothetical protein